MLLHTRNLQIIRCRFGFVSFRKPNETCRLPYNCDLWLAHLYEANCLDYEEATNSNCRWNENDQFDLVAEDGVPPHNGTTSNYVSWRVVLLSSFSPNNIFIHPLSGYEWEFRIKRSAWPIQFAHSLLRLLCAAFFGLFTFFRLPSIHPSVSSVILLFFGCSSAVYFYKNFGLHIRLRFTMSTFITLCIVEILFLTWMTSESS